MTKKLIVVAISFVLAMGQYSFSFAQTEEQGKRKGPGGGPVARALLFESLPESEKKELLELRKKHTEEFRKVMKERLAKKRAELAKLKEENPEKFKEMVQNTRKKMQERLKELKEKDPKGFAQLMQRRREQLKKRLEQLKQNDPEKYEQLKKRIEEKRGKMREGARHDIFDDTQNVGI